MVSISDQAGTLYRLSYTDSGRVQSVLHADASTQNFTYDDTGRLTSYKTQSDLTVSFQYTDQDEMITVNRPDGKSTRLSFDDIGQVTSASNPYLVQISYTDKGLPHSVSSQNLGSALAYSYTKNGLLSGKFFTLLIAHAY